MQKKSKFVKVATAHLNSGPHLLIQASTEIVLNAVAFITCALVFFNHFNFPSVCFLLTTTCN